jgi:polyphenol oxidase
MSSVERPQLSRLSRGALAWWEDPALRADAGVVVAFTERSGGCSGEPFQSLNLAGHVGDAPESVDENRTRLLDALGVGGSRDLLTMAEQVHSDAIAVVDATDAGAGAWATRGRPPVPTTDALVTGVAGLPLALCFADCVPIALVAPGPFVSVVHAGWRGALASLPGISALRLCSEANCDPGDVVAYIGPHINACHYEVSPEIMSQFVYTFGTFARAFSGGLDLDAVVSASLDRAGVAPCNIARLGVCTAEATDRFFSYRAEGGLTGRHGALVCIL